MRKLLLILLLFIFAGSVSGQNLQISGGNTFSAALCDNGLVYAWGQNNAGQLGLNSTGAPYGITSTATPQPVYFLGPTGGNSGGTPQQMQAKQVDAGSGSHAIALACDDYVYVWGEATCQQNGQGGTIGTNCECGTSPNPYPTRVKCGAATGAYCKNGYLTGVKYVSGANNASYAVLNNGDVVAWGENSFGQLGSGNNTDQALPVYVMKSATQRLTNIKQIEGGDRCTYALDENGNVWSWGLNGGNLGRPTTTTLTATSIACKAGDDPTSGEYDPYAKQVVDQSGKAISGIIQISGGDTHGLALAGNGEIWSWGGDWGTGQLGQGAGYQSSTYAARVNAPGVSTVGGPFISNAVFIAAGQASSAAVLADGTVITWGGNGFFNGCAKGSSKSGGVLGNGGVSDGTCRTAGGTGEGSSEFPVYVLTAAGTKLTGITSISDGDAWYFASGPNGIYGWGWNQNGELGVTGNANQPYAKKINQPPCTFGAACPSKPNLGPDRQTCPVFSELLKAGSVESSYNFVWEFSATGTFPAVNGGTPAGTDYTYTTGAPNIVFDPATGAATSNQFTATETSKGWGYYRVIIDDNRVYGPGECGPCPVVGDTIRISEMPNPYTVQACEDAVAKKAKFDVLTPAGSKIKWYTNPTGGTALNPSDSLPSIIVDFNKTNTSFPACSRALFAEDVSTYYGTLRPTTTPTGPGCAAGTVAEDGKRSGLMIEVSNPLVLTSVDFVFPSFGYNTNKNYTVNIYSNNPTGGGNGCAGCTSNKDGLGTLLYTSPVFNVTRNANNPAELITIPTNYKLNGTSAAPVKYWIQIEGGEVTWFGSGSCATPALTSGTPFWTTPEVDDSGNKVLRALTARHDNDYKGKGHVMNLQFYTGTGYSCGRIMVCVSSTCVLPVEFLSFDVTRSGFSAVLSWMTATERNSDFFIVEKSLDGVNYTPVGRVTATGNSSSAVSYSFTDGSLASGITYYRLAQYDKDGKVYYSEVRSVSREGIKAVKVVPNPNHGSFNVQVAGAGETGNVTLILKNSLGQVVYESAANSYSTHINIQHLPSAVYYLEIQTEEGSTIVKVVKE